MKTIYAFEMNKFWRSKKTIAVLAVLVLALVGMIIYNMEQDKSYWQSQLNELQYERTLVKNEAEKIESQLEDIHGPDDPEIIEQLDNQYKLYRAHSLYIYQMELMVKAYLKGEVSPAERIGLWIERDLDLLKKMDAGYSYLNDSLAQVRQRLLINENLIQNKITPLNSPYEMTATNFIYQLTNYPWILIVLIALALLNIDMFSGDVEGGAYKFLYSQPFSRIKILTAKYLVSWLNSILAVTLIIIIVFGAVAMVHGLGDLSYPQYYYSESYQSLSSPTRTVETLSYLPWASYLVRILPLYLLLGTFVIGFIGTVSLLLSNTANTVNVMFCLLIIDFISRTLFSWDSLFYWFWPFTPSRINDVLQGNYAFPASTYLILLEILIISLLATSIIVLRKQDLTGGMD